MPGKKLTYEFVKGQFEKEGYVLLSGGYVNCYSKLDYKCPNGHEHSIAWTNWQMGRRCPYCVGLGKPTIEFIKSEFEKEGYTLLTKKYINNFQKLEYICPEGHQHSIIWSSWEQGHRCPYCAGVAKPTIEFIISEFEEEGYTLLSTEYINCEQKLNYICPNKHKHNISWDKWKQGCRCFYCFGTVKKTIGFIKLEFEKEGYILLTKKYINNRQKLSYICKNNHKYSITWRGWSSGRRCPQCAIVNNSGGDHWNWKGGISCEPYCDVWLDKGFKESIKERDAYECQNPDCWGTSDRLTIHHIDYNKKNCRPENLITLCRSCNVRANYNREEWFEFYNNIMNEKYVMKSM